MKVSMRGLQELKIDRFLGKNTKFDPSDSQDHQCQTIQNFEISNKISSLIKGLGYELATDVLGSNYTEANKLSTAGSDISLIDSIYEWRTGRTSPNDKFIVIQAYNGSEDQVLYWDNSNSRWTQLDTDSSIGTYDKSRFFTRKNALLAGTGVGATNYPIFVKYYDSRSILGGTDNQAAGNYNYRNYLPWDTNFGFTMTKYSEGGTLNSGKYVYYAALIYDDSQIGNISDALGSAIQVPDGDNACINVKVSISDTNGDAVNRRATHLVIYRQKVGFDWSLDLSTQYPTSIVTYLGTPGWQQGYLLATIPLDNDEDTIPIILNSYGTFTTGTLKVTGLTGIDPIANDSFIGCYCRLWQAGTDKIYKRITDNDDTTLTLENATSLSDGESYFWEIVSYWYDTGASSYDCYFVDTVDELGISVLNHTNRGTQKALEVNYKYSITHNNRMYVAPIYLVDDAELHENWAGVSTIDGSGNYSYDVISIYINLEDFGVTTITGLGRILDYIIFFSTNDIHKLNVSSGSAFNWSLAETVQNVGCIAPDSLTFIAGDEVKVSGYYYVSRDGFRVYDGDKSVLISLPIEDIDNYPIGVTDLTEGIGEYNDRLKQWIISFPTDNLVFKYDLRTGQWLTPTYDDEITETAITVDGELLIIDGESVFVMDNDGTSNLTDYNGNDINPVWKSKVYDMGSVSIDKSLMEVSMRYKSNTEVIFNWYVNKSSIAKSLISSTPFPAKTTMSTVTTGFPTGSRGYEFEFNISIDSSDLATNTILEIENITIRYKYNKSLRR